MIFLFGIFHKDVLCLLGRETSTTDAIWKPDFSNLRDRYALMEMAQDLPDLPIGMLTDLHLKRG